MIHRTALLAALALTTLAGSALGQSPPPRFKVTKTDGGVFYAVGHTPKPPWHVFTDVKGAKSTFAADAIASVEPLTAAAAGSLVDGDATTPPPGTAAGGSSPARSGGRGPARTRGQLTFRASTPDPNVLAAKTRKDDSRRAAAGLGWFAPSAGLGGLGGSTATGIPLHVGPRGGVYHITSGGNKSYHSR